MRRISTDVCILGAGPAGLGAAHELVAHGVQSLVVVDRNRQVGGLARTESHDGNLFDVGPHRFFTKNREVNALWHQVLGEDLRPVKRLTRIYYGGKLFRYPLEPLDTLRGFGLAEATHAILSYAAAQVGPHHEPANFEEWVVGRFGHKLYETFFKTYTEKVWGIPCTQIGPEWANQRIKGLDLRTLLKAAFRHGGTRRPKTLVEEFDYPLRGAGMMYERMAELVAGPSRHILTGTTVRAVRWADDRVTGVEMTDPDGVPVLVEAGHYLSSMPITRFFLMLDPPPAEPVRRAAEHLYHRDHITVDLLVDGDDLFPDQWIYVHAPDVRMARVANYNNFSRAMARRPGTTLLSVEYFVFQSEEIWRMSDAELCELARDELARTRLVPRERHLAGWVTRETESYPTYFIGYREAFDTLKRSMDAFANCSPIGRGGMYRYNNMDHSLYTGLLAARNYLHTTATRYDVWAVNSDAEYHESAAREPVAV